MDFSKFDTKKEQGRWVHLEIDGTPLFWDGESITAEENNAPCRVYIRSAASNVVYKAFQKYQVAAQVHQQKVARAKDKDLEAIEREHLKKTEDLLDDVIIAAVEDWENVYFDGKAEKPTADLIRSLIDRDASYSKRVIRMQLFNAIAEDRDFLTNAAQG